MAAFDFQRAAVDDAVEQATAELRARVRVLEGALRPLIERGDTLADAAVPFIDEGDAEELATARAYWIADRLLASQVLGAA